MSKKAGMAAAAAGASVTQPGGLRRFAGGCLVVLILAGLVLGGLVAGLRWWATRPPAPLPCPAEGPVRVSLASGAGKPGKSLQAALSAVLADAGRGVETVSGTGGDVRLVEAFAGTDDVQVYAENPVIVRAPAGSGKAEIRAALGQYRLASCTADPAPAQQGGPARTPSSPWATAEPAELAGLAGLLGWWLVGPETLRALGRAAWPVRRAWRRWEICWWRRWKQGFWGEWPAEAPMKPSRGQRWAENPETLGDRRTPRQQDRAAGRHWMTFREALREGRAERAADRAEAKAKRQQKETAK